jgi:protein-tyrosine phosphatase
MKCDCVLPNLFVGPEPRDEADFEQLRSMKITAILSLQTDEDVRIGDLRSRRSEATEQGLAFHSVPVVDFDRAELRRKLPDCVTVLDNLLKAGQTVYLHCTAGVNRSPTVAVAFLHWKLGWTLDQALAHLLAVRNCCPDAEVIRVKSDAVRAIDPSRL